jgi:hypothetical protein
MFEFVFEGIVTAEEEDAIKDASRQGNPVALKQPPNAV